MKTPPRNKTQFGNQLLISVRLNIVGNKHTVYVSSEYVLSRAIVWIECYM